MKLTYMICLLMARMAFAGSHNTGLMPQGFEPIHIGMGWRSLVSLRPNAEILNIMPDPGEDLKPDPDPPPRAVYSRNYQARNILLSTILLRTGGWLL